MMFWTKGGVRAWLTLAAAVLLLGVPAALAVCDPETVTVAGSEDGAAVFVAGAAALAFSGADAAALSEAAAERLRLALAEARPPYRVEVSAHENGFGLYLNSRFILGAEACGEFCADMLEAWRVALESALQRLPAVYLADPGLEPVPVPLGGSVIVPLLGRGGGLSVADESVSDLARVWLTEDGSVELTGKSEGRGELVLRRGTCTGGFGFQVMQVAGRIPEYIKIHVSGGGFSAVEILRIVEQNVKAAAAPAPGSEFRYSLAGARVRGLAPGESADMEAPIKFLGPGMIPVVRSLMIQIENIPAPASDPARLAFSNSPESVSHGGLLLRSSLTPEKPVRLVFHHRSVSDQKLRFRVRLRNESERDARFFLQSGVGAPDRYEIIAGHRAMAEFVRNKRRNRGWSLTLPAGGAVDLFDEVFTYWQVVSGVMDLVMELGVELVIETLVEESRPLMDMAFDVGFVGAQLQSNPEPPLREMERDSHDHGEFVYSEVLRSERFELGGRWNYIEIGSGVDDNGMDAVIRGNFGIRHRIAVRVSNPTDRAGIVGVVFNPAAGLAGAVIEIDGVLIEVPPRMPPNEFLLKKIRLEPGAESDFEIVLTPQSGSNYPIKLILRAGGCYHRAVDGVVGEVCG